MVDKDSLETASLLKEALKLVDELAKLYPFEKGDFEAVEELTEKAQKLTKHRLWKLN